MAVQASSFSYEWTHDVFLSFRGSDTRHTFTGNLYKALSYRGINTFIDDEELEVGEEISTALEMAIEQSRIAIIVFSTNYASSSFCLDELVHIIECIKGNGRLVLPVFYDVYPSIVRHQLGSYGEAMAKHEERFKANKDMLKLKKNMERLGDGRWLLSKWLTYLVGISNMGISITPPIYFWTEYEHEFIGRIVELVSSKISRVPLHIADYPVGLECRVQKVNLLLEVGSIDVVQMVGIYGVGGIGKTTLARAVYNWIADQFGGICFLENVRENSNKHGLVYLQETLLYEIIGEKDIKLGSVDKGISMIKHRLRRKKVLLIVDDVDKREQLRAIVGGPDWFGPGSRVIITTRDKHLLASYGVERTYEVDGLNANEAFELLIWKAFKNDEVDPSYDDILRRSVIYAYGLPLALELIGSNLFGKSVEEWESALDQYKEIPPKEIQKILKVTFDDLEEDEQNFFLDIACFFDGYKLAEVENILSAHHGVNPKYGIGVLIDKSLIKNWRNHVKLHDLIEDTGKDIVRQESREDPGKRSRLWFHKDIIQVLRENKGTSKIQMIILVSPTFEEEKVEDWDRKAFKEMKYLKTLIIRNVRFYEGPEHLPNSLRVLEWFGYPSEYFPFGFHPEQLTIFEVSNSCLTSLWFPKMYKKFMNMRVLKFQRCDFITQIPDISGVPNLEELSFSYYPNLIEIDKSVGFLDKLKILDVAGCKNLRKFPSIKLISLQSFSLSYCSSLERFPEILGKMEKIKELRLHGTPIKEFPFSIQNLTQLQKLHMIDCGRVHLASGLVMLPELMEVSITGSPEKYKGEEKKSLMVSSNEIPPPLHCNISDEFFPMVLPCLSNVRKLNLLGHNFTFLPPCITECCSLIELRLEKCNYLQEIRWIPPNLETLSIADCISLKDFDFRNLHASSQFLRNLIWEDCKNLGEIRGVPSYIEVLYALHCTSLTDSCISMLLNQVFHKEAAHLTKAQKTLFLPGSKIPECFEHGSTKLPFSFWFRGMFPAISLCAVLLEDDYARLPVLPLDFFLKLSINGKTGNLPLECGGMKLLHTERLKADHIFIVHTLLTEFKDKVDGVLLENEWNHAEVSSLDIYYSDIHLSTQNRLNVFKQKSSMGDIRFTDPYKRDDDYRDPNSMVSTLISNTNNVKDTHPDSEQDLELHLEVLDHQEKAPAESSQAQVFANIQGQDDVEMEAFYASLDAGTIVFSLSHSKSATTSSTSEDAREAMKIVQDFISNNDPSIFLHPEQCSVMKASLDYLSNLSEDDGISGEIITLISEASREFTHWSKDYTEANKKIEFTSSELLRADEFESGLQDNKKQYMEVLAIGNEVLQKLARMEERKKELEEQINAIKDAISSSQSEKDMAHQRKREIFEGGKKLIAQRDELREKVPQLKHEQGLAKRAQEKITDEWSKLGEKFNKIILD